MADTRMCVHIGDALTKGYSNILVSSVDTDVLHVLVIHLKISPIKLNHLQQDVQLWSTIASRKHQMPFWLMASTAGWETSGALLLLVRHNISVAR